MIHVYAFVDEPVDLPRPPGVAGAEVELVEAAGIDVVVSRHDVVPGGDPREDAVAHGLVVEALVAASVLPVRFGERFDSQAELEDALRPRADAIRYALARVRGCVEVGVRTAARGGAAASGARSGTEYLRARLAEESESERLGELLEPLVRATAKAQGETAYLVERGRVDEVREAVRAFAAAEPGVAVAISGPWAPYSFGGQVR